MDRKTTFPPDSGGRDRRSAHKTFFLPAAVGAQQPWVGDVMPYYEDGVFYIYYLKDGGDSFNHSIFLVTTRDFVTYSEHEGPILEAGRQGQDFWMGTGSVVKARGKYYLFYTGHNASPKNEFEEVLLVAEGDSLTSFKKRKDWALTPPRFLEQRIDFRDPQAYYDPERDVITLTVTASHEHTAKVLKFTVSGDLQKTSCDGFIFANDKTRFEDFWNLECTDTFRMGDKYYLTYSAQNDTLWYAMSDAPYGPYGDPKRLDGKLFYSARHVESGDGCWMVGWARRSTDTWGGTLAVQKLCRGDRGELYLMPVDAVREQFMSRRTPVFERDALTVRGGRTRTFEPAFPCFERFLLTGAFTFSGAGAFGLAFDPSREGEDRRLISISPRAGKVRLIRDKGRSPIAESAAQLRAGREYRFTYIQEGDLGIFYIDGLTALTVRVCAAAGQPVSLFAGGNTVTFSKLRAYTG